MYVSASTQAGKHLTLGRIYDARNNSPGIDLFPSDVRHTTRQINAYVFEYKEIKNAKDARDFLNISGSMALKIKAGNLGVEGSAKYLKDREDDENSYEVLVKLRCETSATSIDQESVQSMSCPKSKNMGTHFVRGVIHGAEMIASVKGRKVDTKVRDEIKGGGRIEGNIPNLSGEVKGELDKLFRNSSSSSHVDVTYYATGVPDEIPSTPERLYSEIEKFQKKIQKSSVPLEYELLPLKIEGLPVYIENSSLESIMDSFYKEYEDLCRADNFCKDVVEEKIKEEDNYEEFMEKLGECMDAYEQVIANLDLDINGKGETQFQSGRQIYTDYKKRRFRGTEKFQSVLKSIIKGHYSESDFSCVTKDDFYGMIGSGKSFKDIKKEDDRRKQYNPEDFQCLSKEEFDEMVSVGLTYGQIKKLDNRKTEERKQKSDKFLRNCVLERHLQNPPSNGRNPLYIVLVGKTGQGKSATGNTLLGKQVFESKDTGESVTKTIQHEEFEHQGRQIHVIDTPGLFDTSVKNEDTLMEIAKVADCCTEGIDAFFFVYNITMKRYTNEEQECIKELEKVISTHLYKHLVVVLTHADTELTEKTLEQHIDNLGGIMGDLIKNKANCRVMAVNNKGTTLEKTWMQQKLVEMASNVFQEANGRFNVELIQEAKRLNAEAEKKRKEQLEKEKKGQDKKTQKLLTELSDTVYKQCVAYVKTKTYNDITTNFDAHCVEVTKNVRDALSYEAKARFTDEEITLRINQTITNRMEDFKKLMKWCFPSDATVSVKGRGRTRMDNLKIGDEVLCCDSYGNLFYDPVILFSHADDDEWGLYVTIIADSGETVSLSPNHLLSVGDLDNLRPASDVEEGDVILKASESATVEQCTVMGISYDWRRGAYCPHTRCGTLIVDGVVASCYTTLLPVWLAHAMLFPARLLYNALPLSYFKAVAPYDKQKGMPRLVANYHHLLL